MAVTEERIVVELDASVQQYESSLKGAAATTTAATGKMNQGLAGTATQAAKTGASFKAMRGAVSQFGFQIQDAAVQAQMGTNGLIILGQQGSQLASVFGPGGAVVGAILAVGSALAFALVPSLKDSKLSTEDLTEALKNLQKEVQLTESQTKFLALEEERAAEKRDKNVKSLTEQIEEAEKMRRQFIELRAELVKSGEVTGQNKNIVDGYTNTVKDLNEQLVELRARLDLVNKTASGEGTDELDKRTQEVSKFIARVIEQSNAIGKTTSELLREKAATLELTDAQKQQFDASVKLLEADEERIRLAKQQREDEREGAEIGREFEQFEKEEEALRQFSMTRAEILDEQFLMDLARLEEAQEILGLSEEQFFAKRLELIEDFAKKKQVLETKMTKDEKKQNKEAIKDAQLREQAKLTASEKSIKAGMVLANAFFEDNKAIQAGLIVADTAAAIVKSLSINPYDYANVALIAATGAANLAAALGATKGGGSTPSAPSGSASPAGDEFVPDTAQLDVTAIDEEEGGGTVLRLEFDPSGDDLIDAIAAALVVRQGRD